MQVPSAGKVGQLGKLRQYGLAADQAEACSPVKEAQGNELRTEAERQRSFAREHLAVALGAFWQLKLELVQI